MRLLAICPRIRRSNGCIIAETAWRVRLLTLHAYYRKVVINPKEKTVTIVAYFFWLIRLQTVVPFDRISAIAYGYEDWEISRWFSYVYDSWDCFFVGLRLKSGEEIGLFLFVGDGELTNEGVLPDWVYWEAYLFDMVGSQQRESRAFVDLLSWIINVPVVPARI